MSLRSCRDYIYVYILAFSQDKVICEIDKVEVTSFVTRAPYHFTEKRP